MNGLRKKVSAGLALALVAALAVPINAFATVNISQTVLATDPTRSAFEPILSGGNVAFDGAVVGDSTDVYTQVDIWNIASNSSLWSRSGSAVSLEDFGGDWIAYRTGGMGEYAWAYNFKTKQQWPIVDPADAVSGLMVKDVNISGDKAVWLSGQAPSAALMSMDLNSGKITTETPSLNHAVDIAFDANKVIFTSMFMADYNLGVFDLDTDQVSNFVAADGPQLHPDAAYGLVSWYDGRDGGTIRTKPLSGGAEKTISPVGTDQSQPSVGDRFVTWNDKTTATSDDVYGYELSTGIRFPVATEAGVQMRPTTDGDRIAYVDYPTDSNMGKVKVDEISVTGPEITRLKVPAQAKAGRPAKFKISVSNPDAADVQTVVWQWGDGTSTQSALTGSGKVKVSHAYGGKGTFDGKVTVTDASGIATCRTFSATVR